MGEHDDVRQQVAVVTGGGGGIGAAVAEELGRQGTFVITLDPLVSVDGSQNLPDPEETTAGRIVASGGAARASTVSVTDREGVRSLFADIAQEFGGLDAVVNVAGITRPTSFATGSEDDWRRVLSVHLDGYRNVLDAAIPLMVDAGRGHVLGVTSGSGWRPADTGAYGCAKRAVAALTWQLGAHLPSGVVVNAISPIAMTRMVTAALDRSGSGPAGKPATSSSTGGLSLAALPSPDQLGPLAAHLVSSDFDRCRGQVLFTAGSELSVVEEPRLLEVIDGESAASSHALEVITPAGLVPAERHQRSMGGSNLRFAGPHEPDGGAAQRSESQSTCVVVADRGALSEAVVSQLHERGVRCLRTNPESTATGFGDATASLSAVVDREGPIHSVVIALGAEGLASGITTWESVLADHEGIAEYIQTDAAWSRAVANLADRTERPIRLVTLTDARSPGGRSRAQASAQLARSSLAATDGRVSAFSVSVETSDPSSMLTVGELTAHLLCSGEVEGLVGAELMVSTGYVGLRSHPRVMTSVALGSSTVPAWFDDVIGDLAR